MRKNVCKVVLLIGVFGLSAGIMTEVGPAPLPGPGGSGGKAAGELAAGGGPVPLPGPGDPGPGGTTTQS